MKKVYIVSVIIFIISVVLIGFMVEQKIKKEKEQKKINEEIKQIEENLRKEQIEEQKINIEKNTPEKYKDKGELPVGSPLGAIEIIEPYEIKIYDLSFKGTELEAKTEYDIYAFQDLDKISRGKLINYNEFQRWLGNSL